MSPTTEPRYSLTELADLAGVTPRTVRYYISQGLLPGPGQAGPGAKYDDTDLARLRLIKRLQREHQPLAEIRRHFEGLADQAILALAEETPPQPPTDSALDYIRRITAPRHAARETAPRLYRSMEAPDDVPAPAMLRAVTSVEADPHAPTAPAAPDPEPSTDVRLERSQWERIDLAPDIELHIRRPLARSTAKRVDRLISIARDLLEEDPA